MDLFIYFLPSFVDDVYTYMVIYIQAVHVRPYAMCIWVDLSEIISMGRQ